MTRLSQFLAVMATFALAFAGLVGLSISPAAADGLNDTEVSAAPLSETPAAAEPVAAPADDQADTGAATAETPVEAAPAPAPVPAPEEVKAPALAEAPAPAPEEVKVAAPAPAPAPAPEPAKARTLAAPALAAPALEEPAITADETVTFCHRNGSRKTPYNAGMATSVSAFIQQGHGSHAGPVFPAEGADGKWGDIFPPIPGHFPVGQNWDFIGQSIYNNGCNTDVPVAPVAPTVVQAQCTAPGTSSAPSLQLASTPGIEYTVVGTVAAGNTVTVTAKPNPAEVFKLTAATGWTLKSDGSATFTIEFVNPDCIVKATPAGPTFAQAKCTGPGTSSVPTITFESTKGITYLATPAGPYSQGQTVTVTATPEANYQLGTANGWTSGPNGTATVTTTFDTVDCIIAAQPVAPTVVQAKCTNPGTATTPTLETATTTGVVYTIDGTVAQGETVTVTATPEAGYKLSPATGWVEGPNGTASYTFTVKFEIIDCIVGVTPTAPNVTQAVCTAPGTASTPSIVVPGVVGIDFSFTGNLAAGNTVIITATPGTGYKLNPADGWTMNQDGTATFTVVFGPAPDCIVVATPAAPEAEQAVCTGPGTASTPTLTVPKNTETISYTTEGTVAAGNTVYVIATPAFGHSIAAGNGWMINEDGTATYTITFTTPDCIVVATPAAPEAAQAVCTAPGAATTPELTLPANSDSVSYTVDGTPAQGATVTVTATAGQGHALAPANGWIMNEDGTASYTVTFETVDCIVEAAPAAPSITQAVCTNGTVSAPTLSLPSTTGITYATVGSVANGATVGVTATATEGYKLAATGAWKLAEDGTATLTVTFDQVECPVVAVPPVPVKPAPVIPAAVKSVPVIPAPLASTGFASGWNISLAVLFLAVGAGAMWRSRRPVTD